MNARKIPLNFEVYFWNLVIAFLTIFRDMRTFSQTTPASMPTLKRKASHRLATNPGKYSKSRTKFNPMDLYKVLMIFCVTAIIGFALGFLTGAIIGF